MFYGYYCSPQTRVGATAEIDCPFYILHQLNEMYKLYGLHHLIQQEYPEHHFRGYHERNPDFAEVRALLHVILSDFKFQSAKTTQSCGVTREGWDKFVREPCHNVTRRFSESYIEELQCANPDCSIKVYNGNQTEVDEDKEYEIRMLQYARMILISGYAVSLVATTLGSFLMLILRRLRSVYP